MASIPYRCHANEEGSFAYDKLIVLRTDAKRHVLTKSQMGPAPGLPCCRQQKRSALIMFRDLVNGSR